MKNMSEEQFSLNIENYIREPQDSLDIKLKDIHFNMLKIHLKLRSLYDFHIHSLKGILQSRNKNISFSQLHIHELDNFLLEKFLEKI